MNPESLQSVSNRLQAILFAMCMIVTLSFWLGFYRAEFWIVYGYFMVLSFTTASIIGHLNEKIFQLSVDSQFSEVHILARPETGMANTPESVAA